MLYVPLIISFALLDKIQVLQPDGEKPLST
jgi:hypothetical protein